MQTATRSTRRQQKTSSSSSAKRISTTSRVRDVSSTTSRFIESEGGTTVRRLGTTETISSLPSKDDMRRESSTEIISDSRRSESIRSNKENYDDGVKMIGSKLVRIKDSTGPKDAAGIRTIVSSDVTSGKRTESMESSRRSVQSSETVSRSMKSSVGERRSKAKKYVVRKIYNEKGEEIDSVTEEVDLDDSSQRIEGDSFGLTAGVGLSVVGNGTVDGMSRETASTNGRSDLRIVEGVGTDTRSSTVVSSAARSEQESSRSESYSVKLVGSKIVKTGRHEVGTSRDVKKSVKLETTSSDVTSSDSVTGIASAGDTTLNRTIADGLKVVSSERAADRGTSSISSFDGKTLLKDGVSDPVSGSTSASNDFDIGGSSPERSGLSGSVTNVVSQSRSSSSVVKSIVSESVETDVKKSAFRSSDRHASDFNIVKKASDSLDGTERYVESGDNRGDIDTSVGGRIIRTGSSQGTTRISDSQSSISTSTKINETKKFDGDGDRSLRTDIDLGVATDSSARKTVEKHESDVSLSEISVKRESVTESSSFSDVSMKETIRESSSFGRNLTRDIGSSSELPVDTDDTSRIRVVGKTRDSKDERMSEHTKTIRSFDGDLSRTGDGKSDKRGRVAAPRVRMVGGKIVKMTDVSEVSESDSFRNVTRTRSAVESSRLTASEIGSAEIVGSEIIESGRGTDIGLKQNAVFSKSSVTSKSVKEVTEENVSSSSITMSEKRVSAEARSFEKFGGEVTDIKTTATTETIFEPEITRSVKETTETVRDGSSSTDRLKVTASKIDASDTKRSNLTKNDSEDTKTVTVRGVDIRDVTEEYRRSDVTQRSHTETKKTDKKLTEKTEKDLREKCICEICTCG